MVHPPLSSDTESSSDDEVEVISDGVNEDVHRFCDGKHYCDSRRPRYRARGRRAAARRRIRRSRSFRRSPIRPIIDIRQWIPINDIEELCNEFLDHMDTISRRGEAVGLEHWLYREVGVSFCLRPPRTPAEAVWTSHRLYRQARRVAKLQRRIIRAANCAVDSIEARHRRVAVAILGLVQSLCNSLRPDLDITMSYRNN